MKKNSLPKIGIRPVIDGRRMGVSPGWRNLPPAKKNSAA